MRLVNNSNLRYMLSRTAFQLSRSIDQIIAFDKGIPFVNAILDSLDYISIADSMGLAENS